MYTKADLNRNERARAFGIQMSFVVCVGDFGAVGWSGVSAV